MTGYDIKVRGRGFYVTQEIKSPLLAVVTVECEIGKSTTTCLPNNILTKAVWMANRLYHNAPAPEATV